MIVNYKNEGWQIISQKSHGLLAGQICFNWKIEDRPEKWFETLIAATEHDDASNEFDDDKILNEAGGPLDFSMKTFDKGFYDKMMALSLTKSRYIALLNLRHIMFLYADSEDKYSKAYCKELQKNEAVWLKETDIKITELNKAYQILEWCDALSLLICKNKIQPEARKIEISSGLKESTYELCECRENELKIEPWPFESPEFSITYESKTIDTLSFKTPQAFRKTLLETPVDIHSYKMVES